MWSGKATLLGFLLIGITILTSNVANGLSVRLTPNQEDQIGPLESFVGLKSSQARTQLIMDPLPKIFFVGDEVEIAGTLMTIDGIGVSGKIIHINAQVPTPETILLASGATAEDGTFEIIWKVAPLRSAQQPYQEVKGDPRQSGIIYSIFDGDDEFAPAKSAPQGMFIKLKDLITKIRSSKPVYREGESAIIIVNFFEGDIGRKKAALGAPVDPTNIDVIFDRFHIQLEKKGVGSYIFVTPNLTREPHQITVMPQKENSNPHVAFLTIIVEGVR